MPRENREGFPETETTIAVTTGLSGCAPSPHPSAGPGRPAGGWTMAEDLGPAGVRRRTTRHRLRHRTPEGEFQTAELTLGQVRGLEGLRRKAVPRARPADPPSEGVRYLRDVRPEDAVDGLRDYEAFVRFLSKDDPASTGDAPAGVRLDDLTPEARRGSETLRPAWLGLSGSMEQRRDRRMDALLDPQRDHGRRIRGGAGGDRRVDRIRSPRSTTSTAAPGASGTNFINLASTSFAERPGPFCGAAWPDAGDRAGAGLAHLARGQLRDDRAASYRCDS